MGRKPMYTKQQNNTRVDPIERTLPREAGTPTLGMMIMLEDGPIGQFPVT